MGNAADSVRHMNIYFSVAKIDSVRIYLVGRDGFSFGPLSCKDVFSKSEERAKAAAAGNATEGPSPNTMSGWDVTYADAAYARRRKRPVARERDALP